MPELKAKDFLIETLKDRILELETYLEYEKMVNAACSAVAQGLAVHKKYDHPSVKDVVILRQKYLEALRHDRETND